METKASINLSVFRVLYWVLYDTHTNKILCFDTHVHPYPTPCHRFTKDNFSEIWCEWPLRCFSICSAHLAQGMTSLSFMYPQGSLKMLKSVGLTQGPIYFSDLMRTAITRAQLWDPQRTLSRGLLPVTLTNHEGPITRPAGEIKHFRQLRLKQVKYGIILYIVSVLFKPCMSKLAVFSEIGKNIVLLNDYILCCQCFIG